MAAPNVRSVAAASRTAWDADESTAGSTAESSPVPCRLSLPRESATRPSVNTERHSMHQTSVHAQAAATAPSHCLQQLSASVGRRFVLLNMCRWQAWWLGRHQETVSSLSKPPTRHNAITSDARRTTNRELIQCSTCSSTWRSTCTKASRATRCAGTGSRK